MDVKKTMGKKKSRMRLSRIPTRSEIQIHLKKHAQVERVLVRLVKNLEKAKRDLMAGGGSTGDSKEVALIKEIIDVVGAFLHVLKACISIYNAMSATVEALDTPGVPPEAREQLHNTLNELIEGASKLGCP